MGRVQASIKRVTLGKSLNLSEPLLPSLEIRANSPSLGSKEISRLTRVFTLYEQKRALLESVLINIC